MDKEFQYWQNLWQQQNAKSIDTTALISFLEKNTRKMKRERISIIISFVITSVFLVGVVSMQKSILSYIGIGMIIFAMGMILYLMTRRKLPEMEGEDQLSSQLFLERNIRHLEDQKALTSKYMWWYAVLLILGINLSQAEILQQIGLSSLLTGIIHVVFSLLMLAFFYVAIRKRERQHEAELQQHLNTLRDLAQQLQ